MLEYPVLLILLFLLAGNMPENLLDSKFLTVVSGVYLFDG